MGNHKKLLQFLRPDAAAAAGPPKQQPPPPSSSDDEDDDYAYSSTATTPTTGATTPSTTATTSSAAASPYAMSPWTSLPGLEHGAGGSSSSKAATGLIGSLVKAEGHVYSLAAAGELLYTGTDSRTVRVWRDRRELSPGLRSGSGLVKAILVSPDGRIYTGHQDGKVRVWRRRAAAADSAAGSSEQHARVGSLPGLRDVLQSALRPSRYVETRRRGRSALWMRHVDAVSALSLDAAAGLIYSASWDRTFKVWRAADSKCLESVHAHADAVNAVAAAGFDALVLTGSADGTVKVWRREARGKDGRDTWHTVERVLREGGDGAVTAVAVAREARVVYVGSSDGAVAHWQWRRGAPPGAAPRNGGALWGHRAAVLCLAVAGRVVVSGSADRSVCVWRRTEGADHARIAVLSGHTGPVKCVAMDEEVEEEEGPDGRRSWVVYSGSLDGSVKVWRVADGGAREDAAAATTTATPARTPAASAWTKRASPSPRPLRRWAPYAASPETERVRAA